MDHRYTQSRFYNGAPASDRSTERRDAIVRGHLARARKFNANAQSYGGSTGGRGSDDVNPGLRVMAQRSTDIKDARQVFKEQGSGSLGARASIAEARGFRQPAATPVA
jgi:hypothetical protein